ncbi:MAG: hypothetical protein V3S98_09885 [Dehalococcoidia bacterium]
MAEERTHITTIEGPKGKAEVYEVSTGPSTTATSGVETTTYEIVCGSTTENVPTLGEASIIAHELSGAPG